MNLLEKKDRLILSLLIVSVMITLLLYSSLPNEIPSHWNIKGEIDDYSPKLFALFTALLPFGIFLLMKYLPRIDPGKKDYYQQNKPYQVIMFILVLFFLLLHWIIICSALGYMIAMSRLMPLGIGVVFVMMGKFMGQIEPNYMLGIKTPWTMADEKVWEKTHRIGGFAFIFIGFIFIAAGIIDQPYMFTIAIISIIAVIFYLFIYSYLEFKKMKKNM